MPNRVHVRSSARGPFSPLKQKLFRAWHRSQIGHRSEYSVERLLAFRDYHERTSTARAIAVCMLTPIPALSVTIAIDSIPLVSPSLGWKANYAFWLRLFAALIAVSVGFVLELREVVVERAISCTGSVLIALCAAVFYVSSTMLAAALWEFPVPGGYVLMVAPYVLFFAVATVLVIGPWVVMETPLLRQQLTSHFLIVTSHGVVGVAYPLFSAAFNRLSGIEQTALLMLLPFIKTGTKQIVAKAADKLHEFVGPVVVFSVDAFNVYYTVICMQAATSTLTTILIMVSDCFHAVIAVRDIFRHAKIGKSRHESCLSGSVNYLDDLPAMLQQIFEAPTTRRQRIRISAPFPLPLSEESSACMKELAQLASSAKIASLRRISNGHGVKIGEKVDEASNAFPSVATVKHHRIAPVSPVTKRGPPQPEKGITGRPLLVSSLTLKQQVAMLTNQAAERVVWDALKALFHAEYFVMSEYLEFILPMVYAIYLAAIYHLPVAAYYPSTKSLTLYKFESTLVCIVIFALIEFVSFLGLLALLRRKFGFSPLHQLAFVLETQSQTLQGHLMVWNIYILHLNLVHVGAAMFIQPDHPAT